MRLYCPPHCWSLQIISLMNLPLSIEDIIHDNKVNFLLLVFISSYESNFVHAINFRNQSIWVGYNVAIIARQYSLKRMKLWIWNSFKHKSTVRCVIKEWAWFTTWAKLFKWAVIASNYTHHNLMRSKRANIIILLDLKELPYSLKSRGCIIFEDAFLDLWKACCWRWWKYIKLALASEITWL